MDVHTDWMISIYWFYWKILANLKAMASPRTPKLSLSAQNDFTEKGITANTLTIY